MSGANGFGMIEVTVRSDTTEPLLSGRKATLASDGIVSITELPEGTGSRLVLYEAVTSAVPWVFREETDDAVTWRTLVVEESRSEMHELLVLARFEPHVVSRADLERRRIASYTLQHDITVSGPVHVLKKTRLITLDD